MPDLLDAFGGRSRRGWLVAAVAAVIAAVVLAALVYRQRDRHYNPVLVTQSFAHLAEVPGMRTAAELTLHLPPAPRGETRPLGDISASVDGTLVRDGEESPQFTGTFTATAAGRGTTLAATGDVRIFADAVLFYLRDFPTLLNPAGDLVETWTHVPAHLLTVHNGADVHQALAAVAEQLNFVSAGYDEGGRLVYFSGTPTREAAAQLATALAQPSSGNPVFDIVARLLKTGAVQRLDVWINPQTLQLTRLEADFTRTLEDGSSFDFATLTMSFSEDITSASVNRPEAGLSVKPEVFRRLFGGGEVAEVQVEGNE